jgi:hypothetical protein
MLGGLHTCPNRSDQVRLIVNVREQALVLSKYTQAVSVEALIRSAPGLMKALCHRESGYPIAAINHAMTVRLPPTRDCRLLWLAAFLNFAMIAGCGPNPSVGCVSVAPIPPGEARLCFYRVYLPSETFNMTKVSMNGVYTGYAQLGGAFYRNVPPGIYHIEVESYGVDFNQSAEVALVAGQEAYVTVESLRSRASDYGVGRAIGRDTFYARLMLPQIARAEIAQSFFDGGS